MILTSTPVSTRKRKLHGIPIFQEEQVTVGTGSGACVHLGQIGSGTNIHLMIHRVFISALGYNGKMAVAKLDQFS